MNTCMSVQLHKICSISICAEHSLIHTYLVLKAVVLHVAEVVHCSIVVYTDCCVALIVKVIVPW